MNQLLGVRNFFFHFFYTKILKPILFLFDPENIHDFFTIIGRFLGSNFIGRFVTKSLLGTTIRDELKQKIVGIDFNNPIGLAAGFDKNGQLTQIIPSVGFGFMEIGSITGRPCVGNSKPRLWRIAKDRTLVVYYGLKNNGSEKIAQKLKNKKFKIPLGISLAKTNDDETIDIEKGIADYLKVYNNFSTIGDYFTINISCPNTNGGQPFVEPENLNLLLKSFYQQTPTKPIFLKIPPDLSHQEIDQIIKLAEEYKLTGFVCSNLTKKIQLEDKKGGLSGKAVEEQANDLIRYIYKKTNNNFIIIGCGGVFNAHDAYKKIKLGASLVQLITGMIFEGPQLISEINRELVGLLKRDGYKNISEAVGVDNL